MSSWVNTYKKLLTATHKQHVMVADPDNLFDYEELVQAIEDEGFTILYITTALSVRVKFELFVREAEIKYLMVIPPGYYPLPDIEIHVHFQSINLSQLFPNLDTKALKGLDSVYFTPLSSIRMYENLSYEKTLKFLLENLYSIDADILITNGTAERVLNTLVTVFIGKNSPNDPITKYFADLTKPYFDELILKGLSSAYIIEFLQKQWQSYIKDEKAQVEFKEPALSKSLIQLFALEHLTPIQVSFEKYETLPKSMKVGVFTDKNARSDNELEGLLDYVQLQQDSLENSVDQWFKIIPIMANAKLRSFSSTKLALKERYVQLETDLNNRFQQFIDKAYEGLFSLSGIKRPVVVSRMLEHIHRKPTRKKALIVIDGMNYWQWVLLSKSLAASEISFNTIAAFAFIPTITAWSRQAIFRGERPVLEENNSREGKLFEMFWQKRGIPLYRIVFKKLSIHQPFDVNSLSPDTEILGLVCNDLDDIMHGAMLGNEQLKTSTQQWIDKSQILQLLKDLRSKGFQIFITSDHGNIEAKGIKNFTTKDKVGALSRSKRHLHFTNNTLLNSFLSQNSVMELGQRNLSVYLRHQGAFTTENTQVITHGGSHFWEVIVPFITINEHQ